MEDLGSIMDLLSFSAKAVHCKHILCKSAFKNKASQHCDNSCSLFDLMSVSTIFRNIYLTEPETTTYVHDRWTNFCLIGIMVEFWFVKISLISLPL